MLCLFVLNAVVYFVWLHDDECYCYAVELCYFPAKTGTVHMHVCCLLLLCLLRDITIFIIMLLMHSIWILVDVNGCLKMNLPAKP